MTDWKTVGMLRKARKELVRYRLWAAQQGCCCYCEKPMAQQGTSRCEEAARLGITQGAVPGRRVTLEHLKRRADGGTDQRDNLALACKQCNATRGETDWLTYKSQKLGEAVAA